MRKFEKVSLEQYLSDESSTNAKMLYQSIKLPKRGTNLSAGYDFFSPKKVVIEPHSNAKVPTGIRVHMLEDEWLGIYIRSSFGFKYNIRPMNAVGIIDADYVNADNEGHIWIALHNHGDEQLIIEKGEAFAQGIFQKYLLVDDDEPVEIHRNGGIGSTH
jgi:dUTP pyrophosphatase